MSKNYYLSLALMACAPFLMSACSTALNGSTQEITFSTIGADDAYCEVEIGASNYKYNVRPPQKLSVQRDKDPMSISCTAPGNRVQTMKIESNIAGATYLNGASAGLTLPWDAATGAMYQYPDLVIIDFTTVSAKEQPLPSYHNKGAIDPKAQAIEYLGPDTPALETDRADADRIKAAYDEAARLEAEEAAKDVERERRLNGLEGGFFGDKTAPAVKPATSSSTKSSAVKAVAPPDQKSDKPAVTIAPLSESAPASVKTDDGTMPSTPLPEQPVPTANPKLGKAIFPNSTSF